MKIQSPILFKTAGLLGTAAVRHWMGTLDCRIAYYNPAVDPASEDCRGQKLYIFWHEYILLPFYLRGHCNLAMLLSRHQDAEILSYGAKYMGFDFVRGSTNRGGVAAIRELISKGQAMHLTITPDGPRGPRRVLAPGPIYLASRLGIPIIAMGFGFDRPYRFRKAWDQFAIPRPYSRARVIVSDELHIAGDLDRDGIEHYRVRVESVLNRLTTEAEAWAESGQTLPHESPLSRIPAPPRHVLQRLHRRPPT